MKYTVERVVQETLTVRLEVEAGSPEEAEEVALSMGTSDIEWQLEDHEEWAEVLLPESGRTLSQFRGDVTMGEATLPQGGTYWSMPFGLDSNSHVTETEPARYADHFLPQPDHEVEDGK